MNVIEKKLINAIKANDNDVFKLIYNLFFPYIRNFIVFNSGTNEDAEDILQEAIIIIIKKVRKDGLQITTTFRSYLFAVCRLLWLMELRRRRTRQSIRYDPDLFEACGEQEQGQNIECLKKKLYWYHFNRLSYSCRKLLDLFLNGFSLKDITGEMNYSSVSYTKLRNHQCKNYLKRNIKNDIRFQELNEDIFNEKYNSYRKVFE